MTRATAFTAGAAAADITPTDSQFLYGYPHVERMSTGVHDPLFAAALYLSDGRTKAMLIANDLIWVPRETILSARRRIEEATGLPGDHILISATHTHSAPIVGEMLIAEADPIVPKQDPAYLRLVEDRIVDAGVRAFRSARPAEIGLGTADATGIGTNRHNPKGLADLTAPVLAVRDVATQRILGVSIVCAMHPTVLHEDSKLVSGDFWGATRDHLRKSVGAECPILCHMGAAGNQSPRHVTRGNTFAEAERLGEILGQAVEKTLAELIYTTEAPMAVKRDFVELPLRPMGKLADAEANLRNAQERFARLKAENAPRQEVRTAECDLFGAEEAVTLARAAEDGRLAALGKQYNPAEVLVIRVGEHTYVGWPGEVFVEFGLMVREADSKAFVITLAGGDLQGYLVTREGIDRNWYEANNAIFKSPESPLRLVEATRKLLGAS